MPTPRLITSMTASDARLTSGKCAMATVVGRAGVKRIVTCKDVSRSTKGKIYDPTFRNYTKCTLSADEQLRDIKTS